MYLCVLLHRYIGPLVQNLYVFRTVPQVKAESADVSAEKAEACHWSNVWQSFLLCHAGLEIGSHL